MRCHPCATCGNRDCRELVTDTCLPSQAWKIISERLGHGSVAMTLDLYAHVSPGLQQAAAHGFDRVLGTLTNDNEIEEMSRG